jgi:putative endonuclease
MHFVYVIKSTEYNWTYVGSTADIQKRLSQHNSGAVRSTKYRRPYILIYHESFDTALEARTREKAIKSDRIEKEKIVRNYGPIV